MIDTNAIVLTYLRTSGLEAAVGGRIFCPRLPEGTSLPAISFFTRGGSALPIKGADVSPSIQFDCWADNPIEARDLYGVLFEFLQGTGGYYTASIAVTVGADTAHILEAHEEVHGQDIRDIDLPKLFSVRAFFTIRMKA